LRQGRIPCAFTVPVNRRIDVCIYADVGGCTGSGERCTDRHAEVIVAMHLDRHAGGVADVPNPLVGGEGSPIPTVSE
jgi:hypothetical protein